MHTATLNGTYNINTLIRNKQKLIADRYENLLAHLRHAFCARSMQTEIRPVYEMVPCAFIHPHYVKRNDGSGVSSLFNRVKSRVRMYTCNIIIGYDDMADCAGTLSNLNDLWPHVSH